MSKKRRKPYIQYHHIYYGHTKPGNKRPSQREVVVPVLGSEHQLISRIQVRRPENISKGFWHSIRVLMAAYEPFAREAEEIVESS